MRPQRETSPCQRATGSADSSRSHRQLRRSRVPPPVYLVRFPDDNTEFALPIAIRAPNDGSGRVFIIERCDDIVIVQNGAVLPTPFVSIATACSSEQGILGLAFDPDYATNGTFYVTYTAPDSDPSLGDSNDQVLARYTVSSDPNIANPDGEVILRVPDIADNHNGGDLAFDSQGYLNWSMGDGGVQGDPNGFAQCTGRKKADNNPSSCYTTTGVGPTYYLLGKIIRLDVHNTTASAPREFLRRDAGSSGAVCDTAPAIRSRTSASIRTIAPRSSTGDSAIRSASASTARPATC